MIMSVVARTPLTVVNASPSHKQEKADWSWTAPIGHGRAIPSRLAHLRSVVPAHPILHDRKLNAQRIGRVAFGLETNVLAKIQVLIAHLLPNRLRGMWWRGVQDENLDPSLAAPERIERLCILPGHSD